MTEAEKRAVDERVAREMETMALRYGDVASDASAPPLVPAPCEASWRGAGADRTLEIRAPLPRERPRRRRGGGGRRAPPRARPRGARSARRRRAWRSRAAPTPIGRRRAREETDARVVVRGGCPTTARDVEAAGGRAEASEASEASERSRREDVFKSDALDCVGVGGRSGGPPRRRSRRCPRSLAGRERPEGVDLSDATDWEDFFQPRWALAGLEGERPTLTPHASTG